MTVSQRRRRRFRCVFHPATEYWQRAKFDDDYANGQVNMDMKRENLYKETDRRIKQK